MAVKKSIAIVADTEKKLVHIAGSMRLDKYRILLIAKDIKNLQQVVINIQSANNAAEIEAIDCMKDGCWEADIIILSISDTMQQEVAALIKEVATQKIVIIASGSERHFDEWQKLLPHSKVIHVENISGEKRIISALIDEAEMEEKI